MADDASAEIVRLAAVVGIVRVTRARRGEVLAMTVASFHPRRRQVTVRRGKFEQLFTAPVDDDLHAVLARWVRVRGRLIAENVEGGAVNALFVTCHHTVWRGRFKQVGLPLEPRGLDASWRRWAARTNAQQVGAYGWEPLPARFEQVRRAWIDD
ncbi:hypothetical protein RCO28_20725 [Streptomyces sp. LHD-70]|uniref:hypothetical protein n=1 Tax=Streptomyces sp. LHD-70 TaxID=3072140 RepID=UPI0028102DCB|nr:hypothetical protein [Streptomyces sp. LHD-70]MDQ8704898.1 hypothetical protein [Streptomyces sp. LHD-70]